MRSAGTIFARHPGDVRNVERQYQKASRPPHNAGPLFSGSTLATECVISFRDNRPLGSVEAIQTLIRTHFPSVTFHWTRSGLEQLRIAKERGIEFPPALRVGMESAPSLLEGVAEGPGWRIEFGLGHLDPVTELIIEPRGQYEKIEPNVRAIEQALGSEFRVHGEPAAE